MADSKNNDVRILIVDDLESNRFVLKDIITDMGYQTLMAENGVQALKIVDRFMPQLIISDISMPEMDGMELCRKLKSDPKTRDIPIIFISAYSDTGDIVKALAEGGSDYISKPFRAEIVKARVGLYLTLYETQMKLTQTNRLLQKSVQEQLRMLEMEKKNVLYALVRVGRENAAYDEEHMDRLCYNCRMLAEALQLTKEYGSEITDDFVETISLVAPLCDLGNIGISADILQKKERLTPEERDEVLKHTLIGSRIIYDIQKAGEENEFLQMSYDIAKYHHEYYGGGGYPSGIAGDNIPFSAQIVSVISVYCALTEKRTYRAAYSPEEAVDMISANAGTKYNPKICRVLGMIYRQLK